MPEPLPKKLADALRNQPRYKERRPGSASKDKPPAKAQSKIAQIMNNNVERALFDEILGPLVNPNSNRRPPSPIRSPASKHNVGNAGGLLRPASASKDKKEGMAFLRNAMNDENIGSNKSNKPAGEGHESSFTTSLLARLTSVEKENKELRKQLAGTASKIDNLEHENKKLNLLLEDKDEEEYRVTKNKEFERESSVPRASATHEKSQGAKLMDEVRELRGVNEELEAQLCEMEKFLADYGLVWVGNGGEKVGDSRSNRQSSSTATDRKVYKLGGGMGRVEEMDAKWQGGEVEQDEDEVPLHAMSYTVFERKIKELNDIIYSEPALMKREKFNDKQARLMQPSEYYDSVPVAFYKDGLLVKRGPFRPIGSPGYDSFVKDVMEGYFPSDFRDEYPDGVILSLKDRQLDTYSPGAAAERGLGALAQGGANLLGNSVSLSKEALLARLPDAKISDRGDVDKVKAAINEKLCDGPVDAERVAAAKVTTEEARRARLRRLEGKSKLQDEERGEAKDVISVEDEVEVSDSDREDPPPAYNLSNLLSSPGYRGNKGGTEESGVAARPAENGLLKGVPMSVCTPADQAADMSKTALVRVKWLDGCTLSVRLYDDELVADLLEHIKRHFYNTGDGCATFEIRTAHPPRVLQAHWSLAEANLVPNGTVHAKAV